MQVYAGDFFKDSSPDTELSDDRYYDFGRTEVSEESSGFGRPVNVRDVRMAESDYWHIPPVVYVVIFVGD